MSTYDIAGNPKLSNLIISQQQKHESELEKNSSSVLPLFKRALLDLGFDFQILNQAEALMPQNKDIVIPIVMKYYCIAKKRNEKRYLLGWFGYKECNDYVPFLLEEFYKNDPTIDRWAIGDQLYKIRSRDYSQEYCRIIADAQFGIDRQMIILLLGKLKDENALPLLIKLLEDDSVCLQAIYALGDFKREEFRCYFERFQDSKHPGWRKYARAALKKLDSIQSKQKSSKY